MRAVDIAKLGSDRKKVKEIYMRAFPREERTPFWMMRAMAKMQNTRFLAFYEEALLCGFVYSMKNVIGDAPDLEKRLRRKSFYLRNGFQETGFRIELEKQEQEIIIKNGTFDSREFSGFLKKYSNGTLRPPIWKADAENE